MTSPDSSNRESILIVDDEKTAHQLYTLMLKNTDYRLLHADNGKEAVDMVQRHPEIRLILMDIKMPDMNGYEATAAIRRMDKDVVIIAQTAYALPSDKRKAKKAGCDDYLTKPVDRQLLIDTLSRYLG